MNVLTFNIILLIIDVCCLLYVCGYRVWHKIISWINLKIIDRDLRLMEAREEKDWKKFRNKQINDMYACCSNKIGLEVVITNAFNKYDINKEDVDISYNEEKDDKSNTIFAAHITHKCKKVSK